MTSAPLYYHRFRMHLYPNSELPLVRLALLLVEVAEARTVAGAAERRWNYMKSSAQFPGFSLGGPAAFPRKAGRVP